MKTKKIILSLLFVFLLKNISAQSIAPVIHPTIASFKVSYKSMPGVASNTVTMQPEIKGIPQATVTLKAANSISKVYFKIINNVSNEVVYQVSYNTNSGTINNNDGKKLFENNNGVIFISNALPLIIKPYLYQVQTEDNQNNLSTVYSSIQ